MMFVVCLFSASFTLVSTLLSSIFALKMSSRKRQTQMRGCFSDGRATCKHKLEVIKLVFFIYFLYPYTTQKRTVRNYTGSQA